MAGSGDVAAAVTGRTIGQIRCQFADVLALCMLGSRLRWACRATDVAVFVAAPVPDIEPLIFALTIDILEPL